MKLQAYAKINIGLHILGKRSDGFHDLETVFHEIDMFDEIDLETSDRTAMTADSILVPIDGSNLCLRAALLLQKEQHIQQGVIIHLTKNIPISAGLGGGSSDAAAVLCGLNKFWELDLSVDQLRSLGAQLGSDVPFFINGGSAYATGRGVILEHFALKIPYWIALITPPIRISTAWAYSKIKPNRDGSVVGLRETLVKKIKSPNKLLPIIQNDFELSVFKVYPEIRKTKEILQESGAVFSLMSGSGSSVFSFFDDEQKARSAVSSFPKNYQTSLTKPLFTSRHKSETD